MEHCTASFFLGFLGGAAKKIVVTDYICCVQKFNLMLLEIKRKLCIDAFISDCQGYLSCLSFMFITSPCASQFILQNVIDL